MTPITYDRLHVLLGIRTVPHAFKESVGEVHKDESFGIETTERTGIRERINVGILCDDDVSGTHVAEPYIAFEEVAFKVDDRFHHLLAGVLREGEHVLIRILHVHSAYMFKQDQSNGASPSCFCDIQ